MKKINKFLQKGVLLILIMVNITIPNMKAYSSMGGYALNSTALHANTKYSNSIHSQPPTGFLPALAAVGLGVVFAVGVIDGWNSIGKMNSNTNDVGYNNNDFSKFDN